MAGCMAHEGKGYIYTFGLKSDVTIVFLDPYFLWDATTSAIPPSLYCVFFITHARNVRIFTYGL